MDPLVKWVVDYVDALPQDSFHQVRAARDKTTDLGEQRRLSKEDRRAFAREMVGEKGLLGAASLAVAIPGEQAVKAVLDMIGGIPSEHSRSGFHDPVGSIKAGYSGILQGLDDRGMFGRGPR